MSKKGVMKSPSDTSEPHFHNILRVSSLEEIRHVYNRFPINDEPKKRAQKFAEVAQGSGSHLLKINNPNAQDHVLRFVQPGSNRARRWLFSGNAASSRYAKIIHQLIALAETKPARCLVDHLMDPDELSPDVTAAFAAAYGVDCLQAVKDGLKGTREGVRVLHDENFPVVFVPDVDGNDLQITPISPLIVYRDFKTELDYDGSPYFRLLTGLDVSSKLQNVSAAIGGKRQRFRANFPQKLLVNEAVARRVALGGEFPKVPFARIEVLLDHFTRLHLAMISAKDKDNWIVPDQVGAHKRLAEQLADLLVEHITDVIEAVQEIDPELTPKPRHAVNLLLSRPRINPEALSQDRQALSGRVFTACLQARDLL